MDYNSGNYQTNVLRKQSVSVFAHSVIHYYSLTAILYPPSSRQPGSIFSLRSLKGKLGPELD